MLHTRAASSCRVPCLISSLQLRSAVAPAAPALVAPPLEPAIPALPPDPEEPAAAPAVPLLPAAAELTPPVGAPPASVAWPALLEPPKLLAPATLPGLPELAFGLAPPLEVAPAWLEPPVPPVSTMVPKKPVSETPPHALNSAQAVSAGSQRMSGRVMARFDCSIQRDRRLPATARSVARSAAPNSRVTSKIVR